MVYCLLVYLLPRESYGIHNDLLEISITQATSTLTASLCGFTGRLDHLLPKFEHIFVAVKFSPLSSVQILLLPACCLLCVLQDDM